MKKTDVNVLLSLCNTVIRFLDSVQARGVMYGSNDYSRDKLEDQTIQNALKEYDRYWKYIPGSWER